MLLGKSTNLAVHGGCSTFIILYHITLYYYIILYYIILYYIIEADGYGQIPFHRAIELMTPEANLCNFVFIPLLMAMDINRYIPLQ